MRYCFGIDVGATTVKMGLFNIEETDAELIEKWEIETDISEHGSLILKDIAYEINNKCDQKNIKKENIIGIGIGVPGPVNSSGVVKKAVNLGWGEFNIEEKLKSLTKIYTKAGNDANVAALGEMWKGGGKGYDNIILLTLGTGIGGGIIIDGRIISGAVGAAGEIGHMHINDQETRKCGCGNCGCLEQYASASGIARLAKTRLKEYNGISALKNKNDVSAKDIFDAVRQKDDLAVEIAKEFGEYLGRALADIAVIVNPFVFVIGGGMSKAGEIVIDYIRPPFQKYAFHACKDTKFSLAQLGNDAGIYGAAKMVL